MNSNLKRMGAGVATVIAGRPRRLLVPERVDETFSRYDAVTGEDQRGKQGALLRAPECDRPPAPRDVDRAEDAKSVLRRRARQFRAGQERLKAISSTSSYAWNSSTPRREWTMDKSTVHRKPILAALGGALMMATAAVTAGATVVASTEPAAAVVASTEPAEADLLRDIERTRLEALVDGDVETAQSLMSEDFEVVVPPGDLLTREMYLGAVEGGAIDYLVFEPVSEIEVRLYDQAAALRYRGHAHVIVQDLGEFDHELWFTFVYELRDGQWQAVWEQATGVGGFPPPPATEGN
jgi:Domain of unknown function (DUF4440)